MKTKEALKKIRIICNMFMRDSNLETNIGIVILYPSKGRNG